MSSWRFEVTIHDTDESTASTVMHAMSSYAMDMIDEDFDGVTYAMLITDKKED